MIERDNQLLQLNGNGVGSSRASRFSEVMFLMALLHYEGAGAPDGQRFE